MPTAEEVEAVRERIEWLEESRFAPDGDWTRPSDSSDSIAWVELGEEEKAEVLTSKILWYRFDASQIADVSRRVIAGEEAEFWFDGVDGPEIPVDPEMDRTVAEIERSWPANDNWSPDDLGLEAPDSPTDAERREEALSDAYRVIREVSYEGFRLEMVNDSDFRAEFPDIAVREVAAREIWESEADFEAFKATHANSPVEQIREMRDTFAAMMLESDDTRAMIYQMIDRGVLDLLDRPDPAPTDAEPDRMFAEKEAEWTATLGDDATMGDGVTPTEIARHGENPDRAVFLPTWDATQGTTENTGPEKPRCDFERMLDSAAQSSRYQSKGRDHGHEHEP